MSKRNVLYTLEKRSWGNPTMAQMVRLNLELHGHVDVVFVLLFDRMIMFIKYYLHFASISWYIYQLSLYSGGSRALTARFRLGDLIRFTSLYVIARMNYVCKLIILKHHNKLILSDGVF